MPCCQKEDHNHEEEKCCQEEACHTQECCHEDHARAMMASAQSFGFDSSWIGDITSRWGLDILGTVVEAVRTGLSREFVAEVLEKLGPVILEFVVNFSNRFSMRKGMAADGFVVGEEVGKLMDASILDTVVQRYLPLIFERYGDKIVQLVVEWLLSSLAKK